MPNHCNNRLTILGPPERVKAFVAKANGAQQRYKASSIDIHWWKEACNKAKAQGEEPPIHPNLKIDTSVFSFHQLVPIPAATMKKAYYPDGYQAEHRLWGVKWGAYQVKLVYSNEKGAEYEFDTAWAPPEVFLERVSYKWPDLIFVCSWAEEFPTRGRFIARNGEISENVSEETQGQKPPETLNDDDYYEWYVAWREHYYRKHNAFVASVRKGKPSPKKSKKRLTLVSDR